MKNQEILDDELLHNGKEVIDKRTKNPYQKTLVYLTIMLFVGYGLICFEYRASVINTDFSFYMISAISTIFFCFVISPFLESIWFLIRKFKNRKSEKLTLVDPFWFQIIESTFAIWILFAAFYIIRWLVFRF